MDVGACAGLKRRRFGRGSIGWEALGVGRGRGEVGAVDRGGADSSGRGFGTFPLTLRALVGRVSPTLTVRGATGGAGVPVRKVVGVFTSNPHLGWCERWVRVMRGGRRGVVHGGAWCMEVRRMRGA